eukprot:CAMPEP_0173390746 /NCGR_PEP_ID=MMETSP1356-20130122/16036_1 /TAXON_ID=77927 ORGANISM="Hemiselmis virescens, Strain PCC157" /NCGR_SAMPLE_ID=MMETSP1356 /ASSEMBLY_ACC=CAM_ASM_000847 /LENGTH=49 /DNA_ID= /DNA_START= /DNA_END= /DNA_ORIENTATION=
MGIPGAPRDAAAALLLCMLLALAPPCDSFGLNSMPLLSKSAKLRIGGGG